MLDSMTNQSTRNIANFAVVVLNLAILGLPVSVENVLAAPPISDWMTWPSTYTHDSVYFQRVDQFSQPIEPIGPNRQEVQRSGYRHFRSTIQAGQSADNVHIVEQWGRPVEPYEQWRFPFRPYSVPYNAWGPPTPYGLFNGLSGYPVPWGGGGPNSHYAPYPGAAPGTVPGTQSGMPLTGNPGGPGFSRNSHGNGPAGNTPVQPNGFPLVPPYQPAPWYDGYYPPAPPLQDTAP